jgi:hypothetical protein
MEEWKLSRVESRGIKNVSGCTVHQERTNEGPDVSGSGRSREQQRGRGDAMDDRGQAKQAIERMISDAQAETRSLIGGLR